MMNFFKRLLLSLSFGRKANKILFVIFLLGFFYLLIPGASSIDDFPPLQGSTKSSLEGDTIQNPNIAAYFSHFRRDYITNFYKDFFSGTLIPLVRLPVISINRQPEEAFKFIRDQQESTFLEEYVFPMRESFYVNGYDAKLANDMFHKGARSFIGDHYYYEGKYYNTKTTIRYYPTNVFMRLLIYAASWVLGIYLFKLWRYELFKI